MKTIIVPVDGATNIKLEVLDYDSLSCVFSQTIPTPVQEIDGLDYNCTEDECLWFDKTIRELPETLRNASVIAPVARGASGGLVGKDNTLVEVPGKGVTLAYTQRYPDSVEKAFRERAGSKQDFFLETGSILDFPGSITLIKRFLFEEMERPEILKKSVYFGTYGVLLSGHFLGDYLHAVRNAGNEHSYWMCHTGARNINEPPGTPSSLAKKITSFQQLVPHNPSVVYRAIGTIPDNKTHSLGLDISPLVIPGGHDTCLSHIPIMSTFYQAFPEKVGIPVIHVDAGTWTMIAQVGGTVTLPSDGYKRDIIVQGTVDGEPVVTARYGGGNDFKFVKDLIEKRCGKVMYDCHERVLVDVVTSSDCFILPNINPVNHLTGPFPELKGKIVNEQSFFCNDEKACVILNLTTAITTAHQIEAIAGSQSLPVVITAGGSKDPYFGRLLATLTKREVYAMIDREGQAITETTTLGAGIAGKAACQGIHPYQVDVNRLGITYRKLQPYAEEIKQHLDMYKKRFMEMVKKEIQ